jgi:hypothetical protein
VLVDNDHPCKVGTVKIRKHDGVIRTLTDVRYAPERKKNIIFLSILDNLAYTFSGGNGVLNVLKGALVHYKETREYRRQFAMATQPSLISDGIAREKINDKSLTGPRNTVSNLATAMKQLLISNSIATKNIKIKNKVIFLYFPTSRRSTVAN